MRNPIADLHCHPSLKPHLNAGIGSIWHYAENPSVDRVFRLVSLRRLAVRGLSAKLALKTQSNLDNCYLGNNRLIFCSIYPFEREFLRPDRPFKRAGLLVRTILQLLLRRQYRKHIDSKLIQVVTGISRQAASGLLDQIHTDNRVVDYMEDYHREYEFLLNAQGPRPGGPLLGEEPLFRLARSFRDLPLPENTDTISGILTVEGAHAFGAYPIRVLRQPITFEALDAADQDRLRKSYRKNIMRIKDRRQTAFTPFFVTLAHHFNNFLCGHSRSFAGLFSKVFNQRPEMGSGFSALGLEVVRHFLERGPDQARILIDTKHMSVAARSDYYQMVRDYRAAGDTIPIISSHSAVNGLADLKEAQQNNDRAGADRSAYVSRFSINLTDEDIREIYDSGGLIGICMHDGRMPGGKFKRKLRAVRNYPEKAKRLYAQMFLTNAFHIVKVTLRHQKAEAETGPPKVWQGDAWSTLALGSDNDGIVDPFNTFETAADLSDFREKVIEALKTQDRPYMKEFRILSLPEEEPMDPDTLGTLMMGQSPEQVAERVFYSNTRSFLRTYFTDGYRYQQPVT